MVGGGGVKRTPLKRRHPGSAGAAAPLRARLSREFRHRVLATGRCVMCGGGTRLHAHHIVRAQVMKRHGLPAETVYHPLAGIPVCERCHAQHHAWAARIPRHLIRAESVTFLQACGLAGEFDREYPAEKEAA